MFEFSLIGGLAGCFFSWVLCGYLWHKGYLFKNKTGTSLLRDLAICTALDLIFFFSGWWSILFALMIPVQMWVMSFTKGCFDVLGKNMAKFKAAIATFKEEAANAANKENVDEK